jgi:hypothetical protein
MLYPIYFLIVFVTTILRSVNKNGSFILTLLFFLIWFEKKVKSQQLDTQSQQVKKENDQMKRDQKKVQVDQQQQELRLNRALEEIEKLKSQLAKTQTSTRDTTDQDKKRFENMSMEIKRLHKQKQELIQAFKKQLKLIDILKKQKMHLEAARMLQFSEEEFISALEWNTSTTTTTNTNSTNKNNINSNAMANSAPPLNQTHQRPPLNSGNGSLSSAANTKRNTNTQKPHHAQTIIPKGGTKQSNQRGSGSNLNLSINGESQMRQINNEK